MIETGLSTRIRPAKRWLAAIWDAARRAVLQSEIADVLFVQYTNPAAYPPIEHAAELLAKEGLCVSFVGRTVANQGALLKLPVELQDRVVLIPTPASGVLQRLGYLVFLTVVLFCIARGRRKTVYVSDPVGSPAVVLALLLGVGLVVYHEHDSPRPLVGFSLTYLGFVLVCRRLALRFSNRVVFPSAPRAAATGCMRVDHIVWNTPLAREVAEQPKAEDSRPLRVLYQGSIVRERLPLELIEAVGRWRGRVELSVVGYSTTGGAGFVEEVAQLVERQGTNEWVRMVGPIPLRKEMLEFARGHDLGLALMPFHSDDPNMRHMVGASNKVFDYLSQGIPVLVSGGGEWSEVFVTAQFGIAVGDHSLESFEQALGWCLQHRDKLRSMGSAGRRKVIADWNYERCFSGVLAAILKASNEGRTIL